MVTIKHLHPGISCNIINKAIATLKDKQNGVHKVVVDNDHEELCHLVTISNNDKRVFWAFRGKRKYPSPMILAKDAIDVISYTNKVTFVISKDNEDYTIITCFTGDSTVCKEPATATQDEMVESIDFWQNHALIPDEPYRRAQFAPRWAA